MSARVPIRVDPFRLAARGESIEGQISLAQAARLHEASVGVPEVAEVALRFIREPEGTVHVEGSVRAELKLECQRCLEPFDVIVETPVDLVLVESDGEAERLLSAGRESMVIAEGSLNLLEWVEDELLLGLPLIAMHPSMDQCSPAAKDLLSRRDEDSGPGKEQPRKSPFAVLAGLKKTD